MLNYQFPILTRGKRQGTTVLAVLSDRNWDERLSAGTPLLLKIDVANIIRIVLALTPLLLAPALLSLLSEGQLNLGGGEKDVILVVPWLFWSVVYAFSSFFLWGRGWAIGRATGLSILVATAGVLVAGLILALIGNLGIGGRF